jgi:hypothetical protein
VERFTLAASVRFCPGDPKALFLIATAALSLSSSAGAEVPPRSQSDLEQAPHIVVGTVQSISSRDVQSDNCVVFVDVIVTIARDTPRSEYNQRYVKGSEYDFVRGYLVDASKCVPIAPVGATGIWGLSSLHKGDRVKIYAAPADDWTYAILRPNGLVILH